MNGMRGTPLSRFLRGFAHAGHGLGLIVASQRNFRVHLVVALLVVTAAWHFRVTRLEWVALILCIAWVLGLEAINSALETLADRVNRAPDPLIGRAKDMAAAAVLLSAIGAASVGLLIFIPYL